MAFNENIDYIPPAIYKISLTFLHDGLLAQLVEHRTLNPMVIGSNPIQPTTFKSIQLGGYFLK